MSNDDEELGALIDQLLIVRAGPGYDEMRGHALRELLAIGEHAHSALLARLEEEVFADPILRVLPLFQLGESLPVLVHYLHEGADTTTVTAAFALAAHPHPTARSSLVDALESDRAQTAFAALRALEGDVS